MALARPEAWCISRQPAGSPFTDPDHRPHVFGGACQLIRVMGLVSSFVPAGFFDHGLWICKSHHSVTGRDGRVAALISWPCTNHGSADGIKGEGVRTTFPRSKDWILFWVRRFTSLQTKENTRVQMLHFRIFENRSVGRGKGRACTSRAVPRGL